MKKVLVLHFSQSGQLTEIVNNIANPLKSDFIQIDYHKIEMETPFPFPWSKKEFYGVFPETFLQIPEKTKPLPQQILDTSYDLIIYGYQVWYLTPSLPTTSFLNSVDASILFANTPVVTVIGCRNMWFMAQEKMKKSLQNLKAQLVGNIVLEDRSINHVSVITIAHWMFSGKKSRFLGIFPKPGVSQKDIDEAIKFGPIIKEHLQNNSLDSLQDNLLKADAVRIKPFLITVDKRANILFSKWAKLIISKGKRKDKKRQIWVKMFNFYLLFAIWCIAPIVFILFLLTYLFRIKSIQNDVAYYKSVALK